MCLIIDANVLSLVFADESPDDFGPIRRALYKKKARAVHGGKLTREYLKLKRLTGILRELDRSGAFAKIPDKEVDAETQNVCDTENCLSNDQHIIALARVSKVRLLCSHDQDLHSDFTNPVVLRPHGSVYQNKSHEHLIRKHCKK
jgi:hypothetical protein